MKIHVNSVFLRDVNKFHRKKFLSPKCRLCYYINKTYSHETFKVSLKTKKNIVIYRIVL